MSNENGDLNTSVYTIGEQDPYYEEGDLPVNEYLKQIDHGYEGFDSEESRVFTEPEALFDLAGQFKNGNERIRLSVEGKNYARGLFDDLYVRYGGDLVEIRKTLIDDYSQIKERHTEDPSVCQGFQRVYQSMHARLQYAASTELAHSKGAKDKKVEDLTFKKILILRKGVVNESYEQTLIEIQELKIDTELKEVELEIQQQIDEAVTEAAMKFDGKQMYSRFRSTVKKKVQQAVYVTAIAASVSVMLAGSIGFKPEGIKVTEDNAVEIALVEENEKPQNETALSISEQDKPVLKIIPPDDFKDSQKIQDGADIEIPNPTTTDERQATEAQKPLVTLTAESIIEEKKEIRNVRNDTQLPRQVRSEIVDMQQKGVKVEVQKNGEIVIQYPESKRPLWYGGELDGVKWGSEDYKGKQENMLAYMQEAKDYFNGRNFKLGDMIDLGSFFHPFDESKYIETPEYPECTACGACWGIAGIDAAVLDTELYGEKVFEFVERHEHDHPYLTYTDPKYRNLDPESMKHWTGGPTIWKGAKDYRIRINPELENKFPGYKAMVRISPTSHNGNGPEDPTYAGAQVELRLIPVGDLLLASEEKVKEGKVKEGKGEEVEAVTTEKQEVAYVSLLNLDENYVPASLVDLSNEGLQAELWAGAPNHLFVQEYVPHLKAFLEEVNQAGYQVMIADTYRSYEFQKIRHDDNPKGAAVPGQSQHQAGRAFDLYVKGPNGQLLGVNESIIEMAKKHGITHALAWDVPHFVVLGDADQEKVLRIAQEENKNIYDAINLFFQRQLDNLLAANVENQQT